MGSKLESNRESGRDVCEGEEIFLWGITERFWGRVWRKSRRERIQVDERPFELGREN